MKNYAEIKFPSLSQNEGLARIFVAAFTAPLNPTINELNDIKTAVSEAVTNAIIHGYRDRVGVVEMRLTSEDNEITVEIVDDGVGIDDIAAARQPFFTTCTDGTRSGMGFMVMESFMDKMSVASAPEEGTRIIMKKKLTGKC